MATLLEIQETLINSGIPATTVTVDFDALTVDVNLDLRASIEISHADPGDKALKIEPTGHEVAIRSYDQTHGLDTEIILAENVHPDYPHLIAALVKSVLEEESAEIEKEEAMYAELEREEQAYFYEPPADDEAEELVLQSRRNKTQPWTDVAHASSYAELRHTVLDELERLGFTGVQERLLLVDELDPTGKSDPAADYMTEDNGAQIRVIIR